MKIGDVSRSRRFSDPVRRRWYAHHRAVRFARRMTARGPALGRAALREEAESGVAGFHSGGRTLATA